MPPNTAAVGAVCDAAADTVLSHDTADGAAAANVAGKGAVCNGAAVLSHNATNVGGTPGTSDTAGNFEVFYGAATTKTSKKADISRRSVGIGAGIGAGNVDFDFGR